jgi:HD-like signal output (HDOD) protein
VEVFSQFDERTIKLFSIDQLAHHCWMTSVFARRIAQSEHCASKIDDQCFLAGFLHDLGHLILAAGLPDRYSLVLQQAATSGISTSEAERAEFGATHAEVGAYLLGLWGLPTPVIEAVALHHQPVVCLAKEFSPVIAVHVADALANLANRSHLEPPGTCIDTAHLAALGLDGRIEDWRTLCLAAPK